ncbi:MAG TPA: bifunctional pyr operon transcriptional regulator/uracil phosphoribosyltransferase PyrR [Burkholderiales bacterium]|nr:bifunctional pyr operon transcriptional regulator/uracil phosphoribosyltransferase PyrR [Burkholderiales bacterium]
MTTSLPQAEELLAALAERMRPAVTPDTALIGIHTGGVWIAQRLHQMFSTRPPLGTVDVSFYRDDYGSRGLHPKIKPSDIPFDVTGADIVLVDDVLHTGRTIRAAMNELFDYGRPRSIRLAALVDRGGRQLPIAAQFVGAELDVAGDEQIELTRDAAGRLGLKLNRAGAA